MEKYLLENTKDAQEMCENLRQLLETGEGVNIKLAFTLITGGGLPENLATYVLVSFLWHESEEIQQWAEDLINSHLPEKIAKKWLSYSPNHSPKNIHYMSEMAISEKLVKISNYELVDKATLAMATLKMTKKGGFFCIDKQLAPINEILKEMIIDFSLDLSEFKMEELPEEVTHFVNLRELNISNNKFTELPKDFENLRSLESIYYRGTPLKSSEIKRLEKMMPYFFGENYYNKGCNIYHENKQPKKAITIFKKSTKLMPQYAEGWHNLGACFLDTYQDEKAIIALSNAIKFYDERLADMRNAYDLFWKSCAFALLKNKETAFKFLQEAIDINPSYKDNARYEPDYKAYYEDEIFKKITADV